MQILMADTPFVEEALREAVVEDVAGVPVRVFTAEHLAAIALEAGRATAKARVLQFIEEGALDAPRFEAIFVRHGLQGRWDFRTSISRMTRLQQILESKAAYRRRLARQPIAEKLRIVEELADRAVAIRSRGAKRDAMKSGG